MSDIERMTIGECQKIFDDYGINGDDHTSESTDLCMVIKRLEKDLRLYKKALLVAGEGKTDSWMDKSITHYSVEQTNKFIVKEANSLLEIAADDDEYDNLDPLIEKVGIKQERIIEK